MDVIATTQAPIDTEADTVALAVFAGKAIPHDLDGGPLQALVDAGEAKAKPKHVAHTHAAGKRWVLVGLGSRDELTPEKARVAAAQVVARCKELGTRTLCWELPHRLDDDEAGAFVEGTLLAARPAWRYPSAPAEPAEAAEAEGGLQRLVVSDHADRSAAVARAATLARAQNRARDLQDRAPNDLTPTALAERARELTALGIEVEVLGRGAIQAQRMGLFAGVFQGSDEEPALITLRYTGPEAASPRLGLVGKAVTHDTGGYAIKSGAGMRGMKYDMSGGAAVLEAVAALAELQVPVDVVGVIGATDNMIDAKAFRPGDVLTARNGLTVEMTNPDAEGRLVLGDCLTWARDLGAERLVDLATLTGGAQTALGQVFCALFANDDGWAGALQAAGARTGERVWRLPLDPEYAEVVKATVADLTNSPESKRAHPIMGAEFLHRFAGDVPWAHIDLTAANDTGRAYAPMGGLGWGVRLLVALAEAQAAAAAS